MDPGCYCVTMLTKNAKICWLRPVVDEKHSNNVDNARIILFTFLSAVIRMPSSCSYYTNIFLNYFYIQFDIPVCCKAINKVYL